jgi:hypothetical protein
MTARPSADRNGDPAASAEELFGRLADQMTALVTQELHLARAETRSTVRQAAAGGALLASAGMAGGVGVMLLGLAAARTFSRMLPEPVAYGLVGSAFLAGSGALGLAGRTQLADLELLEHTRDSLEDTGRRLGARLRAGWASHG